ncbi:hypothetical protein SAMN04487997_1949 [Frateuria terrea]|uniref:Uncharacterized protein n=1 Tax=Frateuria terrea TaxID=529704 RepID=A0A1H6UA41_9GAMM|nr:hypothetical protein SAMN04487997_1949 [Frateuria terrea]
MRAQLAFTAQSRCGVRRSTPNVRRPLAVVADKLGSEPRPWFVTAPLWRGRFLLVAPLSGLGWVVESPDELLESAFTPAGENVMECSA